MEEKQKEEKKSTKGDGQNIMEKTEEKKRNRQKRTMMKRQKRLSLDASGLKVMTQQDPSIQE